MGVLVLRGGDDMEAVVLPITGTSSPGCRALLRARGPVLALWGVNEWI
jgi:hypothetical protein